mgnify:CR=1 FL=1
MEGTKPEELIPEEAAKPSMGICITTSEEDSPYERTLHLIPKVITVGIGCKKNTPAGRIEEKVLAALAAAGDFSKSSSSRRASIDLKAQEPGILQLVGKVWLAVPDLFCRRTGNRRRGNLRRLRL